MRGFDAIVSSTTAWAKGVRVPSNAVHVCYINTVSRFAFASDEYVPVFARPFIGNLIAWDREAATRPTRFVANSRNVAERIRQYYGRDSDVLHCPVDLDRFSVGGGERRLLYRRLAPVVVQTYRLRHSRRCDRRRAAVNCRHRTGGACFARAGARHDDDDARLRFRRAPQRAYGQRARRDRAGRRRLRARSARSGRRRPSNDRLSLWRRARNGRRRRDRRLLRRAGCRVARRLRSAPSTPHVSIRNASARTPSSFRRRSLSIAFVLLSSVSGSRRWRRRPAPRHDASETLVAPPPCSAPAALAASLPPSMAPLGGPEASSASRRGAGRLRHLLNL